MHGLRLARYGDVNHPGRNVRSQTGVCSAPGCDGTHVAKGLCTKHYQQMQNHGSLLVDELTCARCGDLFTRPYKGNPHAVRFCSHACRYAEQLDGHRADPLRAEKLRKWRADNPEKLKAHLLKRDNLKRGHGVGFVVSGRDLARLVRRFSGMCAYCGERPYEHFDHVIPLARGGRHCIANLLPACASCNLSKGAKLVSEWRLLAPVPRRFRRSARELAA